MGQEGAPQGRAEMLPLGREGTAVAHWRRYSLTQRMFGRRQTVKDALAG